MKKLYKFLIVAVVAMASMGAQAALPLPGVYKIKNVYSGTYVKLQHSQLADITATEETASDLYVWYTNKPNGEGLMTELSGDGGDMMETLDMIKGLIEELLEYNEMPTWFLEEMFQLHLVSTGDADGSVYLCVDVPAIDDWENIKTVILDAAGGQSAVTYYISHMVPGNRHYMGIDYDGSFGYRLEAGTDEGTDIKWLMETEDADFDVYAYVKKLQEGEKPYLALNEADAAKLSMTADTRNFNPGAVFRMTTSDGLATQLRTQGVDFAQAVAGLGELSMPQAYTADDKFNYPARYLRLAIPADASDVSGALAAVGEALGTQSAIYQAMLAHADLLVPNTAVYFVSDGETVSIIGEADRLNYADAAKWVVEPINSDDVYFAANPTEEYNGKYYTTLYTDFPYQIANPEQVKALVVPQLNEEGEATFEQLAELGANEVPARTAVVLECASQDVANNLLVPVIENANPSGAPRKADGEVQNVLQGVFFNNQQAVEENTRVLTVNEGELYFTHPSGDYLPGNMAWLMAEPNPTGIADIKVSANAHEDGTIYDLTGRRVVNPTQGIYIINHKKVVVK